MIKIHLDIKDVLDACKDSYEEVTKQLTKSFGDLGTAAHAHIRELAKAELNSHQYLMFVGGEDQKNIDLDTPAPNIHILTIKNNAVLIDDGKEIDMKTDEWLFKSSKTKIGKKGKYLAIPFKYDNKGGKSESESGKFKAQLTGRIKEEIALENKRRKFQGQSPIHFGGIERYKKDSMGHKKGEIIEGKLHEFNIFGNRKKQHWSEQPLTRVGVYQKIQRDTQGNPITDKAGKVKATRTWMTFRTASQGVPDKFWYPAPPTKDFLARTGEWVEQEFYNKILPAIFQKWGDK
jgi:hypothetical protein